MIPRVPHSWLSGGFPYEVLEATKICPQSTHKEVLDESFELQRSAAMSQEIRRAWDQVRTPAERLAIDFFLYNPYFSRMDDAVDRQLRTLLRQS
jgi:hypothetical protein